MVEMITSVLGGAHVGPEHRHWADTSRPSNTVSIISFPKYGNIGWSWCRI